MVNLKIYKMTMTEKFSILANFVKDISSETKDLETFLLVKEKFSPSCFAKLSFKTINSGDFTGIGEVLEIKGSGSFE